VSIDLIENYRVLAPLRLSLAGGGTDVEPFATEFGSRILNFAINLKIELIAAIEETNSKRINLKIISGGKMEKSSDFSKALTRALKKRVPQGFSLDLVIRNPAGPGSGLGTSSALIVACRLFIESAFPSNLRTEQLIQDSFDLERKEMKIEGGFQDFFPAVYGGMNWLIQHPGQSTVSRSSLDLEPKILDLLKTKMYVVDLGIPRNGELIIRDQVKRYQSTLGGTKDSLISQLEIADSMKLAVMEDNVDSLLLLLDQAYVIKKSFTPLITNPKIDLIEQALRKSGGRGIKISGAGGGGHMFCFFPKGIPCNLQSKLPIHTQRVKCDFSQEGWQIERSA